MQKKRKSDFFWYATANHFLIFFLFWNFSEHALILEFFLAFSVLHDLGKLKEKGNCRQ